MFDVLHITVLLTRVLYNIIFVENGLNLDLENTNT